MSIDEVIKRIPRNLHACRAQGRFGIFKISKIKTLEISLESATEDKNLETN